MRILVLSTVRMKHNGIATVILQYYNQLKNVVHFDFVCLNEIADDIRDELESSGSKVYVLKGRNKTPIKYINSIKKICKKNKYDIAHIHGNSETMAFELLGCYLGGIKNRIVHVHATNPTHKTLARFLRPCFLCLYNYAFACSKATGDYLYKKKKYNVLPNAFKVDDFSYSKEYREKCRNELNINDDTNVIGYIAVMNKNKNHLFLLDVFKEYLGINNNAILLLIGTGSEFDHISNYAKHLEIDSKVIMLGERSDVNVWINAIDYIVFPSLSEGFGISLLEAEANGIPIIANQNGIIKAVKLNNNFIFSPLDDHKQWAKTLESLPRTRDPNGCINVKNAGYDIKEQAIRLYKFYQVINI